MSCHSWPWSSWTVWGWVSSSPPQRRNHRTFEGWRTVDGEHLGRGLAWKGGARTLFSPSAMSLVSLSDTVLEIAFPWEDGGDKAGRSLLSPVPPGWLHRICRLTCFLRRPRETGKSHQVTSGMYRPVPTCPITANYFSEKNLKDVLQWECKTS